MAYLALYREWRPQTFRDIVGQEHVTRTLRNAVEAGRTGHAYLFCGSRGTGKTTTAKVLAKALNCLDRNGPEPCNRCVNCQSIAGGYSVDVVEIDAASNRGIDEIRDLREKVKFAPTTGQFRVYIIDEVHMLTNEAFNALLKTLEEPPQHVVFILATTEPHKVPLTILSRCQRFDFRRISPDEITGRLKEVAAGAGIAADEEALLLIARAAEGGMRDALSILDQGAALGEMKVTAGDVHNILGTVRLDILSRMAGYLAAGETGPALRLIGELTGAGKDLRLFAREMAAFLRAIILERIAPGDATGGVWGDALKSVPGAADFSEERLIRAVDILIKAEQEMKWGSLPGVILELALVKACRPEITYDLSSLAARVAAVEEKLKNFAPEKTGNPPADRGVSNEPHQARQSYPEAAGRQRQPEDAPDESGAQYEPDQTGEMQRPAETVPEDVAPGDLRGEAGRESVPGVSLEQVRASWGDIMEALRKERPPIYPNFIKAVPLQVREHSLSAGFPEGAELACAMAERPENKKYFEELLGKFFSGEWQVNYRFYQGEIHMPAVRVEPANDISRRFNGKEVIPADEAELSSLFDDE